MLKKGNNGGKDRATNEQFSGRRHIKNVKIDQNGTRLEYFLYLCILQLQNEMRIW